MKPIVAIILILSIGEFLPSPSSARATTDGVVFHRELLGAGEGRAITVSPTGNTFVFGRSGGVTELNFNSSGTLLSAHVYGNGFLDDTGGEAVASLSSGEMFVTGEFWNGDIPSSLWDVGLMKFNSTGSLEWQTAWGRISYDQGFAVATDLHGNAYVGGYTESSDYSSSLALTLKFNSAGTLLWARTWGGKRDNVAKAIAVDSAGNIYVAGFSDSFASIYVAFLLKYDSLGNLLWQRLWKNGGNTEALGMTIDPSGVIYITGWTSNTTDTNNSLSIVSTEVFLLAVNTDAQTSWQRVWEGQGCSAGQAVALNATGSIFVTGYSQKTAMPYCYFPNDALLLIFNPTGSLSAQFLWGGHGHGDDVGNGIAVVPSGGAVIVGSAGGPPYSWTNASAATTPGLMSESTPSGGSGTPTGAVYNPKRSLHALSTSEAGCSGSLFLLKYGPPPLASTPPTYHVRFQAFGGSLIFCGNRYLDGESNDFPAGNYTAFAQVSFPPVSGCPTGCSPYGTSFLYWNATGGVKVSNSTSIFTNVSVTGPGSLAAIFHIEYLAPGALLPLPLYVTLIIITIPILIRKRKMLEA